MGRLKMVQSKEYQFSPHARAGRLPHFHVDIAGTSVDRLLEKLPEVALRLIRVGSHVGESIAGLPPAFNG
jgi:hypothetical protein